MEPTGFFDIGGNEILSNSLVRYSDVEHSIIDNNGYIVKNLLGVWEVINVSEQTGNNLSNATNIQVIGTR